MQDDLTSHELDNAAVQKAVLRLVLASFPISQTIPAIANRIDGGDAVEHAVAVLVEVGLLERRRASIRPTSAALHFDLLR